MDKKIVSSEFVHKETENGVSRGIALMTMDDGTFLIGTAKQFNAKKPAGKNKGKTEKSGIMNGMIPCDCKGDWEFVIACGNALVELGDEMRKKKAPKKGAKKDESDILEGLNAEQLKKLLKALKNL